MIITDKKRLIPFINLHMPPDVEFYDDGFCSTIGWEVCGEIVGGVLYEGFRWPDINMHIATDGTKRWANRRFIFACFDYPFNQLKCYRVTAVVCISNSNAVKLVLKLGFKLEGRLRKAFPSGEDALLFGMLKEECRWLKLGERHG